jgi:hypothetical protein
MLPTPLSGDPESLVLFELMSVEKHQAREMIRAPFEIPANA